MPIEFEKYEDHRAIVVQYIGTVTAEDIDEAVMGTVAPFMEQYDPEPAHVIYDVRQLEVEFADFIKYIGALSRHDKQGKFSRNWVLHYVGQNDIASAIRTWISRKFKMKTSAFDTVEAALDYIRSQNEAKA